MYSPTPVLMSSTYTSILQITQTFTSFWTTQSGSAGTKTVSRDFGGGGGSPPCDTCDKGGSHNGGSGGGGAPPGNQGKTFDAWTHANANNAAVQTPGSSGWGASGSFGAGNGGVAGSGVVWSSSDRVIPSRRAFVGTCATAVLVPCVGYILQLLYL